MLLTTCSETTHHPSIHPSMPACVREWVETATVGRAQCTYMYVWSCTWLCCAAPYVYHHAFTLDPADRLRRFPLEELFPLFPPSFSHLQSQIKVRPWAPSAPLKASLLVDASHHMQLRMQSGSATGPSRAKSFARNFFPPPLPTPHPVMVSRSQV